MNKKSIIIIAIVIVLCLGIGGGAMFYFINQDNKEKVYYYSPGEYFVTNMKDTTSFVKVTITIAYNDKKAAKDLEANNAVIRNAIVFTLRSKTKDEMKDQSIENLLSDEICAKLNEQLNVDYFVKVYFSDLVIQG